MNKREPDRRSQFSKYCMTAVACILIVAVCFVFTMFSTDTVNWVTPKQESAANNIETPMKVTTTVREIEDKKNTNLSGIGSYEGGDPNLPGITTDFNSNGEWYQDLTDDLKQGGGSVIATVDVGGVEIGLYGNLPWPASDSAYAFNAPTAQKDVINWLNQGGDTGIDPNRRGVFVFEHNKPTWTQEVDGVTCLGFAPVPSIVNREYCNGFTTTMWQTQSTPARAEYGYAKDGVPRKYCAILQKDGNTYYLPLVAQDAKGHTFPGGALQTHMQILGTSGGNYILNIGDHGHRSIQWSVGDIVNNLDNIVSSSESSPLRDYIKVNIEIYNAPKGSLTELNQYTIMGFIAY